MAEGDAVNRGDDRTTRVERQLAEAQALTHIGSWHWDLRTNAIEWSDELFRIYGIEPRSREITFEFFVSRLHPDDQDRVVARVRAAVESGGRFAYPERILRPDGSVRALDTVGEVVRDERGAVTGLLGTCRDVTDEHARDEQLRLHADIVKHIQIALAVWEVGDPDDPSTVRLVAYNPAAEAVARTTLPDKIGKSVVEIFPYAARGQTPELLTSVARDGRVREVVVDRSRNPVDPHRAVAMKAFPLPGKRVGLAVEDITEIAKARRLRDSVQDVLEKIATGAPLREVLDTLVLAVEGLSTKTKASVLLLDHDGAHLRVGAAPHMPEEYVRAVDGLALGPRAGPCGTAAYRRSPVIVHDIQADPEWADFSGLAQSCGLRACWATPILDPDGQLLGTFELHYAEPRSPGREERELIARATYLAGIAITRTRLEEQLRALSARAEQVREDERSGIAREIHDDLGQALTAIKIDLAWLARRVSGDSSGPGQTLLEKLDEMSRMTDDVIGRVRRISSDLRPGVLDDLGLLAAVEWEASRFEERTGVSCVVASNLGDDGLERDLSTAVFRIAQEALTNVARHAEASNVAIHLNRSDDGRSLTLRVRDDGMGIRDEAAREPTSLGLLGMRERARRLGGTVSTSRAQEGGTLVEVIIPLAGKAS
jgi:PAS domain S-box-containing protein